MKFETTLQLEEYRVYLNKIQESDFGTDVKLFGVYETLDRPVVIFNKLTKKYLYEPDGTPHSYLKTHVSIFTSGSEAWKYFYYLLRKRKRQFEEFYIREEEALNQAAEIIRLKFDESPEYFL